MKKIEIITGKIKAGKTTYLLNRLENMENVYGILQPVINGERFFKDVKSKEKIQISSKTETKNTFKLGKYFFYYNAFTWAKEKLKTISEMDSGIIIIDEYGPLEFKYQGLEPVVTKIMKKENLELIIIVRELLVKDFLTKFKLSNEMVKIVTIKN